MKQRAEEENRVADAPPENWVDTHAPAFFRPYARLARLDRPIGWWLLLLPCWWSVALASEGWPSLALLVLFFIGAVAMRGAGCTWNDIVDRDIDAAVARTRSRPIPSGAVSVAAAWTFLLVQCLAGLAVLLTFNSFAIALGFSSLLLVAIYPFMKRITYWPQFVLGLAFNWGALMGWAAVEGSLSAAPVLLYLGAIAWTVGYDTIYAHQDREDDALIGVKSTALKFGASTKKWLWFFYGVMAVALVAAGAAAGLGFFFYPVAALALALLVWQIVTLDIDDPARCLRLFRSNRDFGLIVFVAIVAGQVA
ncbi:4-hydroxybenzoate octaprenyltransferase [Parvibaculum sp.]|uniref:4-hydroxybenzoate octaprenyltransferase n=1 Tax=Parvibaculum sp. TaxID=2024848 RepID=UPI001B06B347|nr:4-hydroxybenzoate octaprenyltransferase [Parvibaculum sp.]MBO6678379.1 4-hydroxybenzoate octaprenyltransferase [Parvibaculum sp.]MBO6684136.1 4-hydroxybenzoate octaprenyltransferase [Parvibaculum sp.]MBO6903672.1 4-hydroxybenzoate octaprenyltransferase [Parvibaculum sp.]